MNNQVFCIVDIETTGCGLLHDRIIDISAIKVKEGKIIATFQSLLNPNTYIPSSITNITGISSDDVKYAPSFDDITLELKYFLESSIFVAHNARFDYGFIKNEFRRVGVPFSSPVLCTARLSKYLFPRYRRHNLDAIIERFDIKCEARHRACGDAKATYDFLMKASEKVGSKKFAEGVKKVMGDRAIPVNLEAAKIRSLPETPGVYFFYGKDGEVLYVGKSKNLRTRVMSHFAQHHSVQKEMRISQAVHRVEVEETAGELGALLLESSHIKNMSPLYNRMSRRVKKLVVVRKTLTEYGYLAVSLEHIDTVLLDDLQNILGVYKSLTQAKQSLKKIGYDHELCPKLLGIEKTKGACFYIQLNKCGGACLGTEEKLTYNKKVLTAFKYRKIKTWPYEGPVMIEEKRNNENGEAFIVDNWCLLTVIKFDDGGECEQVRQDHAFDYDAYKILARYIMNPINKRTIKPLTSTEYKALINYTENFVTTEELVTISL